MILPTSWFLRVLNPVYSDGHILPPVSVINLPLSHTIGSQSSVSISPGYLLKMGILRPHFRSTLKQEMWDKAQKCLFNKPRMWFWWLFNFKIIIIKNYSTSINQVPRILHSDLSLTILPWLLPESHLSLEYNLNTVFHINHIHIILLTWQKSSTLIKTKLQPFSVWPQKS